MVDDNNSMISRSSNESCRARPRHLNGIAFDPLKTKDLFDAL